MTTIALTIDGMSCGHCAGAVKQAVASVQGAQLEDVRIGAARVRVEDEALIDQVRAAIEEAGYPARVTG